MATLYDLYAGSADFARNPFERRRKKSTARRVAEGAAIGLGGLAALRYGGAAAMKRLRGGRQMGAKAVAGADLVRAREYGRRAVNAVKGASNTLIEDAKGGAALARSLAGTPQGRRILAAGALGTAATGYGLGKGVELLANRRDRRRR